jgi:hypothetical protein
MFHIIYNEPAQEDLDLGSVATKISGAICEKTGRLKWGQTVAMT